MYSHSCFTTDHAWGAHVRTIEGHLVLDAEQQPIVTAKGEEVQKCVSSSDLILLVAWHHCYENQIEWEKKRCLKGKDGYTQLAVFPDDDSGLGKEGKKRKVTGERFWVETKKTRGKDQVIHHCAEKKPAAKASNPEARGRRFGGSTFELHG